MSVRTCVSKNAGDDKPLRFTFMCYAAFVFPKGSQDLLCALVLIKLDVTTKARFCPQWMNVRVRRWFKAFLMTVWHCKNLKGRMQFIPYLDLGKMRVLRVVLIGSSSHWRMELVTRLSMFSTTPCLPKTSYGKMPWYFREDTAMI